MSGVCSTKELGDACQCPDQLHRKVAAILNPELKDMPEFDPLNLKQSTVSKERAATLAILMVAFVALDLMSSETFEIAFTQLN